MGFLNKLKSIIRNITNKATGVYTIDPDVAKQFESMSLDEDSFNFDDEHNQEEGSSSESVIPSMSQEVGVNKEKKKFVIIAVIAAVLIILITCLSFCGEEIQEGNADELMFGKTKIPRVVLTLPDKFDSVITRVDMDESEEDVDEDIKAVMDSLEQEVEQELEEDETASEDIAALIKSNRFDDLELEDKKEKIDLFTVEEKDKELLNVNTEYKRKKAKEIIGDKPVLSIPRAPESVESDEIIMEMPTLSYLHGDAIITPLEPINPNIELLEVKTGYSLPKVSDGYRKPWIEYSKRVDTPPNFKRISIVVKSLGLNKSVTDAAIESLPANISLSFSPYTKNIGELITKAREFGHEAYIDLPLEGEDFPNSDVGPKGLITEVPVLENLKRLKEVMASGGAYSGLLALDGAVFAANDKHILPVMKMISERGLIYLDGTKGQGLPVPLEYDLAHKLADIIIDGNIFRNAIEAQLKYAERLTEYQGDVLIVIEPNPLTFKMVFDWLNTFSMPEDETIVKALALVPVSNLVAE